MKLAQIVLKSYLNHFFSECLSLYQLTSNTIAASDKFTNCQSEIPLPSDDFFFNFARAVGRQGALHKENSGFASNSWSAHFHVLWLSNFNFYQKPLYKSLHQSFFYSFITILPSESCVTLHFSTILPQILLFRHLTYILKSTNVISRY